MSITSAFNNALSGLNVSSRRAELVSNNISNALTDGFARREITLSSLRLNGQGGGVRVEDVSRVENAVLTSARREVEAKLSAEKIVSDYLKRISDRIGNPGEISALTVQFAAFETAFTEAANDPSNDIKLNNIFYSAKSLATNFNSQSSHVNEMRKEIDENIGTAVNKLNQIVHQLDELNSEIRFRSVSGAAKSALLDKRDMLIDDLNTLVPVKVVPRENNQIAIFTASGGALLDGSPTQFDFSAAPAMAHSMTITNGALSDLVVNGSPINMLSGNDLYAGGGLEALFELRDSTLPNYNTELDALAANLAFRFQDPAVDPTLNASDTGLFSDAGVQITAPNIAGLAERIIVDPSSDPSLGGAWRLRSGLNAPIAGDVGDNSILRNYLGALQTVTTPSSGMSATTSMNAHEFAKHLSIQQSSRSVEAFDKLTFTLAETDEIKSAETGITGVDTDRELQSLMEVEAAYSANARVISVLDSLLNKLLEI